MCSVFKKCFSTSNNIVEPAESQQEQNTVSIKSYTKTSYQDQFAQPDIVPTNIFNMPQKNIIVFVSSVRPQRMADRALTLVKNAIEARGMKVTVFDPSEMQFELIQNPLHFMNPADAPAWLREANQLILDADGFVIVTAEYNCSLPPALANMMDHFSPASYRHRPVGLVGYSMGPFGGVRALTLLRAYVAEFGMLPLPQNVTMPTVHEALTEDGKDKEGRISKNVEKLVHELEWYVDAISNHKKIAKPSEHSF
jgi:NAD(P)H-dependent FMN reductase